MSSKCQFLQGSVFFAMIDTNKELHMPSKISIEIDGIEYIRKTQFLIHQRLK
jgi:hypothetical protein